MAVSAGSCSFSTLTVTTDVAASVSSDIKPQSQHPQPVSETGVRSVGGQQVSACESTVSIDDNIPHSQVAACVIVGTSTARTRI